MSIAFICSVTHLCCFFLDNIFHLFSFSPSLHSNNCFLGQNWITSWKYRNSHLSSWHWSLSASSITKWSPPSNHCCHSSLQFLIHLPGSPFPIRGRGRDSLLSRSGVSYLANLSLPPSAPLCLCPSHVPM